MSHQGQINRIKCILIGPSGVGKTSIINKYLYNNYETFSITIGCDFYINSLVLNNIEYKLHIWDTAGNIKYNNMASVIKSVNKILIVLDYINRNNEILINNYMNIALNYTTKDNIILVFNKTPTTAVELDTNKTGVIFCNSKYNINIDKIFLEVLHIEHKPVQHIPKNKCAIL